MSDTMSGSLPIVQAAHLYPSLHALTGSRDGVLICHPIIGVSIAYTLIAAFVLAALYSVDCIAREDCHSNRAALSCSIRFQRRLQAPSTTSAKYCTSW